MLNFIDQSSEKHSSRPTNHDGNKISKSFLREKETGSQSRDKLTKVNNTKLTKVHGGKEGQQQKFIKTGTMMA